MLLKINTFLKHTTIYDLFNDVIWSKYNIEDYFYYLSPMENIMSIILNAISTSISLILHKESTNVYVFSTQEFMI